MKEIDMKITKADFEKYEKARFAGVNMIHLEDIRVFSGLKKEIIIEIQKNFKLYYNQWNSFGERWD